MRRTGFRGVCHELGLDNATMAAVTFGFSISLPLLIALPSRGARHRSRRHQNRERHSSRYPPALRHSSLLRSAAVRIRSRRYELRASRFPFLVLAVVFLPRDRARAEQRVFDLQGFLLLSPGLVVFLNGADHIGNDEG